MRTTAAIILLATLWVGGLAQADEWAEWRAAGAKIQSIRATFVQKKNLAMLGKPLVSKGEFYFQAPGSMRWEYVSPIRTLTLLNDAGVSRFAWVEGAYRKDAAANLESLRLVIQDFSKWMRGDFANPQFQTTYAPAPARTVTLRPLDQAMAPYIQQIEIVLAAQPGVIKSVTIRETETITTVIEFTDVRLNEPIPAKVFAQP
jgi:outer membrane lipoprotein-sorting protein